MLPVDRPSPLKCPTKKKCFRSVAEAQPYIDNLAPTEHPSQAKLLIVYRCRRYCGWFHIGHDRGPMKQRTTRRGKHAPKFT